VSRCRPTQPALLTFLLACLVAAVCAAPAGAIQPLGEYGLGEGGQAGLLDRPTGVAVDSAGRVYVSERTNNRISVFSGDGRFLRCVRQRRAPGWPRRGVRACTTICKPGVPGEGPGELTSPGQIAVDADGSVYVLEGGQLTPRVSVFDAQGRFLRVFGRDVDAANPGTGFEVSTSKCKAATRGSRAGELDRPLGMTIDPAGILWITDVANHRLNA
jgi:DNA-binding beta-propeller fold protein YncE